MIYFLAGAFVGSFVTFSAMLLVICADDKGRVDDAEREGDND